MASLLFKDHAAYLVNDKWDADNQQYHYDEVKLDSILPYLGAYVSIGRNFLFGDLISLVEKDVHFFNMVFHCTMGRYPLQPFLAESHKPTEKEKKIAGPNEEGICYLFIDRACEYDIHSDGEPSFQYYTGLHGWGYMKLGENSGARKEDYGKMEQTTYSLSFTPLNELLHYPFKLDEKLDFISCDMSKNKGYKRKITSLGDRAFTLYEVLYTIFDDISFFGSPEKRDEEAETLDETIKESKEHPEDLIPWEDVKKDLKKSGKERKKKNKENAPNLIAKYTELLNLHKDPENIEVKRLYMENRGNKDFAKKVKKLNEVAGKDFIEKL